MIEVGAANFGWQNYRETHLMAELEMADNLEYKLEILRVNITDNHATVTFNYHFTAEAEGKEMEGKGMGTAVLRRTEQGWKLFHYQTS